MYVNGCKLFIQDEIIIYAVECMNLDLELIRLNYQRDRECFPTYFEKLHAFLAFLYLAGEKHLTFQIQTNYGLRL